MVTPKSYIYRTFTVQHFKISHVLGLIFPINILLLILQAVAKLPSNADLSNCNLEFLPETLFINAQLSMLNLRHNALKHRPTEEDIYTIGWLEDLPR